MDTTCLIISGGDFSELPEGFRRPAYVIACDRGWQYALRLGLTPDLILGDFDSSPLPDTEIPVLKVPTRKDDTDTMLAARKARELGYFDIAICCAFGGRLDHAFANIQTAAFLAERGAKTRLFAARPFPRRRRRALPCLFRKARELGYFDIAICCAFGGRLDHAFANIQTAAFLAERGAKTRLFGKDTEGLVFAGGEMAVPRKAGWSLSLFSLSDKCEGVSIRGTKYEGEDITLTNTFPLGVSNVWTAENAEITVKTGILLVLSSKLAEGEHI